MLEVAAVSGVPVAPAPATRPPTRGGPGAPAAAKPMKMTPGPNAGSRRVDLSGATVPTR